MNVSSAVTQIRIKGAERGKEKEGGRTRDKDAPLLMWPEWSWQVSWAERGQRRS